MKRKLHALRFEITPPTGQGGLSGIVIGVGDPSKAFCQPANRKKSFDVVAGDRLIGADCH